MKSFVVLLSFISVLFSADTKSVISIGGFTENPAYIQRDSVVIGAAKDIADIIFQRIDMESTISI